MATLYSPDAPAIDVQPANGRSFSLKEMQSYVGGFVELVTLADGRLMFVDEDGKHKGSLQERSQRANGPATDLLRLAGGLPGDYVVGNALVCDKGEVR